MSYFYLQLCFYSDFEYRNGNFIENMQLSKFIINEQPRKFEQFFKFSNTKMCS